MLGVALTLVGPAVEAMLERTAAVQSLWVRTWPYVQWIPAAIFIFAAIELLYLLPPNLPARQRVTVPGALIAAAGWLAISRGLGFYFHYFGSAKLARTYEFLATPIAVMIWLYLTRLRFSSGPDQCQPAIQTLSSVRSFAATQSRVAASLREELVRCLVLPEAKTIVSALWF